ncbi:MAG: anaerobic ribonucleoside-triphosphate reductase activating protein [Clostridiales bacterium]|nr:anaerobic ribonucleoside-triphosphate reductase activating protein [Candidatus Blautia equi]
MNYHNITKDDMLNGDGLRVVLWVAGCLHHCPECQNPVTWNPEGGLPFGEAEKAEIFKELDKDYISGITFSGGDPLHPANRAAVTALAKEIREKYPEKTIWLYTGYLWEEVCQEEIMDYLDVCLEGKFEVANKLLTLHWVGSTNQRVIDVKKTRQAGRIVIWSEDGSDDTDYAAGSQNGPCGCGF